MTLALGVDVDHDGQSAIVSLRGEIDYGNVSQLRSVFVELAETDATDVTVDLAGVDFLDSTVLSVLIQGKQRLEESGRQMSVINPQPRIQRVLELAGVLEYLRF
ncbi:MAG: STAS domain-containing protein [Acidimicrobiia bacterium]